LNYELIYYGEMVWYGTDNDNCVICLMWYDFFKEMRV